MWGSARIRAKRHQDEEVEIGQDRHGWLRLCDLSMFRRGRGGEGAQPLCAIRCLPGHPVGHAHRISVEVGKGIGERLGPAEITIFETGPWARGLGGRLDGRNEGLRRVIHQRCARAFSRGEQAARIAVLFRFDQAEAGRARFAFHLGRGGGGGRALRDCRRRRGGRIQPQGHEIDHAAQQVFQEGQVLHAAPGEREAVARKPCQRGHHLGGDLQRDGFKPVRLSGRGDRVGMRFHAVQYRPAPDEGDEIGELFRKRLI